MTRPYCLIAFVTDKIIDKTAMNNLFRGRNNKLFDVEG